MVARTQLARSLFTWPAGRPPVCREAWPRALCDRLSGGGRCDLSANCCCCCLSMELKGGGKEGGGGGEKGKGGEGEIEMSKLRPRVPVLTLRASK